jgi:tRNA pseudouridine55 synthase
LKDVSLKQSGISGLFLINKNPDVTSTEVVNSVKRHFKFKKAGHCGTLDPLAEGLLLISINRATRLTEYIQSEDKEYIAIIKLGEQTTTDDREGNVIKRGNYDTIDSSDILALLKNMEGTIEQQPPLFSAIKKDGVRAYSRARKGDITPLKKRLVQINNITLIDYSQPLLKIRINCGKGTYVRSIARDIGVNLGCFAHLHSLIRTKTGVYSVDNALRFDRLKTILPKDLTEKSEFYIPLNSMLSWIDIINISDEEWRKLSNGMQIKGKTSMRDDRVYRLINRNNELIGIGISKDNEVFPRKILKLHKYD